MRKLTYFVAATLDGFIAEVGGGDPTAAGHFLMEGDHMEYLFQNYGDTLPYMARDALGIAGELTRFDTVLEGRKSYESGVAQGVPDAYLHLKHYVFSSTLTEAAPTVELVRGDALAKVKELKQQDGLGIYLVGGGALAAELLPEIDEVFVKQHPTVMGKGIPMFNGGFSPDRFELADLKRFDSGVLFLSYQRRG
ncbi:dihydrofolate reductase family protein [Crossiella sp. CA-258035]|uniref:dihydrofolate reductase family protein n=1 Tax=Crossiella sp. CA-258035 TaxID=2981138 RepID=UPI0024BD3755|nr:dihydrofolate reductase family protein [Crossiella sp. CA-258035]WHT17234.1 dihydrofolate reductase family protein [Crossiella sp. CA-258035]